jgi:alkaline phosphatase
VLAGGRSYFRPNTSSDLEDPRKVGGERTDNLDLIEEWKQKTSGTFLYTRDQLLAIDVAKVDKILGLVRKCLFICKDI